MEPKKYSKEDMKIGLAWLKGELPLAKVGSHFQSFNSNAYHKIAMSIRQAYQDGKLILK